MFQIFNISDQVEYLFLQKLVLGCSHAWKNFFFAMAIEGDPENSVAKL